MENVGVEPVSFMAGPSAAELRAGLRRVAPELAGEAIRLRAEAGRVVDPVWRSGSAVVGGAFVAKFAWSQQAAIRIRREGQLLRALQSAAPDLQLPGVVAVSADPVLLVTRIVPGEALTSSGVAALDDAGSARVAAQLARFLARLHDPDVLEQVQPLVPLVPPEPQADTHSLRQRFGRWVSADRRDTVLAWCDWVDEILSSPRPPEVLVHGDLHGHNQLWDLHAPALNAVVDFDISGPREREFDFRYLPSQAPESDLFVAVVGNYRERSARELDLDRLMAWHVRTVLGDALWRSEAGVPLPGGGNPSSWVDALQQRLLESGIDGASPTGHV